MRLECVPRVETIRGACGDRPAQYCSRCGFLQAIPLLLNFIFAYRKLMLSMVLTSHKLSEALPIADLFKGSCPFSAYVVLPSFNTLSS